MRGRIGVDPMIDRNDQIVEVLGASIEIRKTNNATPHPSCAELYNEEFDCLLLYGIRPLREKRSYSFFLARPFPCSISRWEIGSPDRGMVSNPMLFSVHSVSLW